MAHLPESTAILSSSALNPWLTLNPQPSTAAVQEGLLRQFAREGAAFHDEVMMALLGKEWTPA